MGERASVETRREARADLIRQAAKYETRFGITFDTFVVFPRTLLETLHQAQPKGQSQPVVPEPQLAAAVPLIEILTGVANTSSPTLAQRRDYLDALLRLYALCPNKPSVLSTTLTVAPQREGTLLAESLRWLPPNALTPQAKRIPLDGGLAVGMQGLRVGERFDTCNVIDGAVASGATVMALMELLQNYVKRFELYTLHAPASSLCCLHRYAKLLGTSIRIHAAHVSGVLNEHYYAVEASRTDKLIVGDLGDTIAPLFQPAGP